MPISEAEWLSISTMIEKVVKQVVGKRADYFVTGKVIKVDIPNKCVFLKEFGDQAIPIVGFDYTVKYYDETPNGTNTSTVGTSANYRTTVKTANAKVVMPKKGDLVLVARELGIRRLPRCLGVIQGKNWITAEEE
jgi:hypothetical protein